MAKKIVGLVGPIGSGKSSVADFLVGKGFVHLRFSQPIEVEIKKRGLPLERRIYQDIGDSWRTQFGLDYISQLLLKEVDGSANSRFVIDGFRNLGEIAPFKENKNFFLIGLVADWQVRYRRLRKRGLAHDPKTKRDFLRQEKRDLGGSQPDFFGQNNWAVLELADIKIDTNKALEAVLAEVADVLKKKGII